MNKIEFLTDLERKLSILDEQEINDIINEYGGIIDEKIKDGKSETEAVNEFGNIEELSSEILKTYKINPNYRNGNANGGGKATAVLRSFEEWVRHVSDKIAKFSKNVSDGLCKSGGAFIFARNTLNFEYVDSLPVNVKYATIEKTLNLEGEKKIIPSNFASIEYEIDERLINGEVVLLVSHIDKTGEIRDIQITPYGNNYYLIYASKRFRAPYDFRIPYDLFINGLKNNKVYNYSKLIMPGITLKANEVTMAIIK